MAIDLGFSGQESDINRACSAFGLDTVNYRAFPNNGPVPVAEPEPIRVATAPLAPDPLRIPGVTEALQLIQPPAAMSSAPPANFVPTAPLEQQWAQMSAPQWATAPAAGPGIFSPTNMQPTAAPRPSAQPHNDAALPGGGFSLLRQALPSVHPNAASPMSAFAMARTPLQPLPSGGVASQAQQVANPVANSESFGIAFGTAFNAAFGHGGTGFQRPQT